MLIRIAPEMFNDVHFDCFTVPEVREEIFKTSKFKSKYSWRADYKNKIRPIRIDNEVINEVENTYKLINLMIGSGIKNRKGRFIDLSHVDKRYIAYSITLDLNISTGDNDLIDFVQDQFEKENHSALSLINHWIKKNMLCWNDELNSFIKEWDRNDEPIQPKKDALEFEELTGTKYMGP